MDLVDEQHVALVELGEDRRQVARPLERRSRRDVQMHAHLGGDDARQRGLAQPWRPGEQHVVDRLVAAAGRAEHDVEVLLELRLADELGEMLRSQARFDRGLGVVVERRIDELVTHDVLRVASARRGASSPHRCRRAARVTPRGSRRARIPSR